MTLTPEQAVGYLQYRARDLKAKVDAGRISMDAAARQLAREFAPGTEWRSLLEEYVLRVEADEVLELADRRSAW